MSRGHRVLALRKIFGWTQHELAVLLAAADYTISQAMISRIENGESDADNDLVDALCDIAGLSHAWFETDIEPMVGTFRFRRLKSKVKKSESERIEYVFTEMYRLFTEMATAAKLAPPDLQLATSTELSADDIEEWAERTRSLMGLPAGEPLTHVTRACERARIVVAPVADPGGRPLNLQGHFGISAWRAMWDTPLIGVFPSPTGDHRRHTIGHELGHLVLHTDREDIDERAAEKEADRFAGAFLFPRRPALEAFSMGRITLDRLAVLKAGWGISIAALIMRAYALGVIDRDRQRSLFIQMANRGWRRAEPVEVGMEQPMLGQRLLQSVHRGQPSVAAQHSGLTEDLVTTITTSDDG